jgi:sugar transferase (PEP-CTERM/EpsH1 system associated)
MKIVSDKCKTMDMAFIFSSSMAQYVLDLKIPKIMDFIDADSDKWSQYAKYGKFPANIIYKRESVLLAKHEEKILKNVYASIAVSESETEALKSIYPKANLFSVSNGVDFNHFKPTGVKPKDNIITFTGEMNYFANVDAVTYFYTSVLPLIKQKVPDAIFYIVGRNPDKKVLELQKDKTVIVTGEIPDVREFISTAKVCAVPMRIGRGIQNKVLEAMSMEKSVVATPLAVRGIKVIDEKEIFVAGNAEIFAKKVIDLLNNEPLRESTGKSARKAIEERYSWDTNLKALDRIITELPILGGTY